MKKQKADIRKYPDALTTLQARECLGCGKTKLFEMIDDGRLFSIKVGRIRLIPKTAIIEVLNKEKKK